MATFEFVLPELGEGMEAGDVVQVLVTVGRASRQSNRYSNWKPTRPSSKCQRR